MTDKHVNLHDPEAALATLRQILGASPELESLQRRLDDHATRSSEIAAVLEQAIATNIASEQSGLSRVLEQPVSESIARSIKRDPSIYIDALFPIIGQVVRRYISQALASFVQSTGSVLENSFSPRALKWRVQAALSGVPFREMVLQKSFAYYIDEVFLIERQSGLLMCHVSRNANSGKDPDAVSALLTAITDFASDSFNTNDYDNDGLDAIDVGGAKVWLIKSAGTIMALLIHGNAPIALRDDLQAILENVFIEHGELIRRFDGDKAPLKIIEPELMHCFELVQNRHQVNRDLKAQRLPRRILKYLFWLILGGYLVWFAAERLNAQLCKHYALKILHNASSVVVSQSSWHRQHWYLPQRDLHFKIMLAPKDQQVMRQVNEYVQLRNAKISFTSTYYQPITPAEARDVK